MIIPTGPDFPSDIRELLETEPELLVSGRPLSHFNALGEDFFFDDCKPVYALPFVARLAIVQTIPLETHPHLPPDFRGTYPVIGGYNPDSGDEYNFGVSPVLEFRLAPKRLKPLLGQAPIAPF